ncbi:MAG: ATP-dependent sacrificial sulfur transferase LarE [Oscillospiraceae bacterium]|nr:ATP-dependent sacrificial sulfur transferase LarE [Oscillospiraceae bacterium]
MIDIREKHENLRGIIENYGSLAVAFSGGADSTLLLKVAYDVLGGKTAAVTARSRVVSQREIESAAEFCEKEGIKHIICDFDDECRDIFAQNPPNRCYLCKNEILKKIKGAIGPYDLRYIAEGSHTDDDKAYRPGFLAVIEHGVKSPLREAGFTKAEIRELSKTLGLPTWNKQSCACLASRFAYGDPVQREKIDMIEKAEQLLAGLGFSQIRVRIHGTIARIEINPEQFPKIVEPGLSGRICAALKQYGFTYAALDLEGYRFGSMDTRP